MVLFIKPISIFLNINLIIITYEVRNITYKSFFKNQFIKHMLKYISYIEMINVLFGINLRKKLISQYCFSYKNINFKLKKKRRINYTIKSE